MSIAGSQRALPYNASTHRRHGRSPMADRLPVRPLPPGGRTSNPPRRSGKRTIRASTGLLIAAGLDPLVTGAIGNCPLYQRLVYVPRSLGGRSWPVAFLVAVTLRRHRRTAADHVAEIRTVHGCTRGRRQSMMNPSQELAPGQLTHIERGFGLR